MGRDRQTKVLQYIHDDRPQKLKSYVKKHKLDLSGIELSGGGNLLHLASAVSSGVVLRYLLKEDVNPLKGDNSGNLALHVLLRRAITDLDRGGHLWSTVHTEMIIPMCKACPAALCKKDRTGKTAQDLLDRFICQSEQRKEEEEFVGSFPGNYGGSEEDRWKEKLIDECSNEYNMNGGAYEDDYVHSSSQYSESYDEWAERLEHEHRKRHSWYTYTKRPVPSPGASASSRRCHDDGDQSQSQQDSYREQLNKEREKMKRKYKGAEAGQESREKSLRTKRRKYEERYDALGKCGETDISELSYDDIPWPHTGSVSMVMDVLLSGTRKSDPGTIKKCLRDQLVRWHPDKFEQKLGSRLKASDREKILTRVTEISQALNKINQEGHGQNSRTTI